VLGLLEAIEDPTHERHAQLTEWIGDDFDPNADPAEWIIAEGDALAKIIAEARRSVEC